MTVNLTRLAIVVFVFSSCASLPARKTAAEPVFKYSIVSIDTAICGQLGTFYLDGQEIGQVEIVGYIGRGQKSMFITIALLGDHKETSEFYTYSNYVAFRLLGETLIGTIRLEEREDGEYMIFNFPASLDTLEHEESMLKRYKSYTDFDASSLIKKQEDKLEKLRKGYEMVLRSK